MRGGKMRVHGIAAFITALAILASATSSAASFPSVYDKQIEAAAKAWLPGVPWKLLKGQFYQESRLDPAARSPVGAEGIAQMMPGTWADISKAMGWGLLDRRLAEPSITAGAFYMAKLRNGWTSPRPEQDRHSLAMASFNAGFGSILAAQRACGNPPLYDDIIKCLPQITGRHARETLGYVPAIYKWHRMMELER